MGKVQAIKSPVTYKFVDGSEFADKGVDANDLQAEIEKIQSRSGNGKASNQDMLDYAKSHPGCAIDKLLEHDPNIALDRLNLILCGKMSKAIVLVPPTSINTVDNRKIVLVKEISANVAETGNPKAGRKNIVEVAKSKDDLTALDNSMIHFLKICKSNLDKNFALAPSYDRVSQLFQNMIDQI